MCDENNTVTAVLMTALSGEFHLGLTGRKWLMVWKRFYCCCETEKVAGKFKGPKLYDLFYLFLSVGWLKSLHLWVSTSSFFMECLTFSLLELVLGY